MSQDTNLILEGLPTPTFERLQRHLSFKSWERGSVPMDVGNVASILFPVSGLASIVMPYDGRQVDMAIVGADGAIDHGAIGADFRLADGNTVVNYTMKRSLRFGEWA